MNIRMQWWILWICILLKVEHRKWMTYLNWEYVTFLSFKFEFNAITNVVTQPNLPLCSISSSFKGLETSCWSFEKGTLSHSCLIVPGCLCHIFCFMMFQLVSVGERSGLQADTQHPSSCPTKPSHKANRWNTWFSTVFLKYARPSLNKMSGNMWCSKTCIYLSVLMAPSQIYKLPAPHVLYVQ